MTKKEREHIGFCLLYYLRSIDADPSPQNRSNAGRDFIQRVTDEYPQIIEAAREYEEVDTEADDSLVYEYQYS